MTTGMVERAVLNDAEADALRVLANIYIGTPDCHIRREDANALINYMSRLENERSELRSALTAEGKRLDWLMPRVPGSVYRAHGVTYSAGPDRAAIDAAMEKANG